jgi:hypothetical protein
MVLMIHFWRITGKYDSPILQMQIVVTIFFSWGYEGQLLATSYIYVGVFCNDQNSRIKCLMDLESTFHQDSTGTLSVPMQK